MNDPVTFMTYLRSKLAALGVEYTAEDHAFLTREELEDRLQHAQRAVHLLGGSTIDSWYTDTRTLPLW